MKTEREKFCAILQGPYSGLEKRRKPRRDNDVPKVKEEHPSQIGGGERPNVNYEKSGVLSEDTNLRNGVLLKHTVPVEARIPTDEWFVMSFNKVEKTESEIRTHDLEQTSSVATSHLKNKIEYIIGTEKRVRDLSWGEPTMSRQHAVICFRLNSRKGSVVSPYLMDLESLNGTRLNGDRIEPCRYYEILDGDLVTFADGDWEHVFILEPKREADDKPLLAEDDDEPFPVTDPAESVQRNAVVRAMARESVRQIDSFDTAT